MSASSTFNFYPQVIFVRHGETVSNKVIHDADGKDVDSDKLKDIDPELTVLGKQQALKTRLFLSKRIREQNATVRVWASPFQRTQATAEPFYKDMEQDDRLIGYHIEPLLQEHITSPIPECFRAVGVVQTTWIGYLINVNKLNKKIEQHLAAMQPNEYLVIFGHSLTISLALSYMSINPTPPITPLSVTHHLPNCSISVAACVPQDLCKNAWRIYQVGSIAHLDRDRVTGIHCPFGFI